MDSSAPNQLGLFKRVLPESQMTHAGEIIQKTFEDIDLGPHNDYIFHPTIESCYDLLDGSAIHPGGLFNQ